MCKHCLERNVQIPKLLTGHPRTLSLFNIMSSTTHCTNDAAIESSELLNKPWTRQFGHGLSRVV